MSRLSRKIHLPRIHHLLLYFAALLVSGIASPAFASSILFDFNSPPASYGTYYPPNLYTNPVFSNSGFTVTHQAGAFRGLAKWNSVSKNLVLHHCSDTPCTAAVAFSEPVDAFTIDVAFADPYGNTATITPILQSGDGAAITIGNDSHDAPTFRSKSFAGGPYIGFRMQAANSATLYWDNLSVLQGYPADATSIRDVPAPAGPNVPIIQLNAFNAIADNVAVTGTTNADFCVAPDPRQIIVSGQDRYVPRKLKLIELSGKGSCTGPLPAESGGALSWESLLAQIDLQVEPWYRSYKGGYILPGQTAPTQGYWLVIGVVRSSAQYLGPVAVRAKPEALISYLPGELDVDTEAGGFKLKCNTALEKRPLSLGGTVAAFGDFINVEEERMIMEAAQCNAPSSLTRRTTHVFPVRLDRSLFAEALNIALQLNGIRRTIDQAYACMNTASRPVATTMRQALTAAQAAIILRKWDIAVAKLEQIAYLAKASSFGGCLPEANYQGNLMARALSSAFTVWDRFKFPVAGAAWQIYKIPAGLDIPLLTSTAP